MARRKGLEVTDVIDATAVKAAAGGPADERSVQELAAELFERAKAEGMSLVGPDGLLSGLTKMVLETSLEAELGEHLGYEAHDPAGHNRGNSRNGTRERTVRTEIGPVQIEVPRDRAGSFEPVIVPKRRRRPQCAVQEGKATARQMGQPTPQRRRADHDGQAVCRD